MNYFFYILENKIPKTVNNIYVWGRWLGNIQNRIVRKTIISTEVRVSTIFRSTVDRYKKQPHKLFETWVIGGEYDGYIKKYSTWAEAEAGHDKTIEMLFTI